MSGRWWAAAASIQVLALAGAGAWMRLRRPAPAAKAVAPDLCRAVYEGPEVMLSGRIERLKTVLVGAPIDGAIEEFDAWALALEGLPARIQADTAGGPFTPRSASIPT